MIRTECVDLLRQMVGIPSESQKEKQLAIFIQQYLKDELGMETRLQHISGESYNIVGRWRTKTANRRKLMLGGHIDTVSPGTQWPTDPYKLTQRGDELHGLGTADMKGGLAAQLTVLKRIRDQHIKLNAEIEFVGLADEERYSIGAHAYVDFMRKNEEKSQDTFFIMGEPHYSNVVIGAAGKALLSLNIKGREGHASHPESGINAIDCMAELLAELQKTYWPKYRAGKCGSLCSLRIESAYGGYSLTIPDQCTCWMNKQLLPCERIEDFILDVEQIYSAKVGRGKLEIHREIPNYPAYLLPDNQSDVEKLRLFLKNRFHREPQFKINQSVSDGNILYHELQIPTVLFGPDGVDFHTEREYVTISSLDAYMEELYDYLRTEYTQ